MQTHSLLQAIKNHNLNHIQLVIENERKKIIDEVEKEINEIENPEEREKKKQESVKEIEQRFMSFVNARDSQHFFSAFMLAVFNGKLDVCEMLLTHGVSTTHQAKNSDETLRYVFVHEFFPHQHHEETKAKMADYLYMLFCQDRFEMHEYEKIALLLIAKKIPPLGLENIQNLTVAIENAENKKNRYDQTISRCISLFHQRVLDKELPKIILMLFRLNEENLACALIKAFPTKINSNKKIIDAPSLAYAAVKCQMWKALLALHKISPVNLDIQDDLGWTVASELVQEKRFDELERVFPKNKKINYNAKLYQTDGATVTIGFSLILANKNNLLPFDQMVLTDDQLNKLDDQNNVQNSIDLFEINGNIKITRFDLPDFFGMTPYYVFAVTKNWNSFRFLLHLTRFQNVDLDASLLLHSGTPSSNIRLEYMLFSQAAPLVLICETYYKKIQSGWDGFDFNFKPYPDDADRKNYTFMTILLMHEDDLDFKTRYSWILRFLPYQKVPIDLNASHSHFFLQEMLFFYRDEEDFFPISYQILKNNFQVGQEEFDLNLYDSLYSLTRPYAKGALKCLLLCLQHQKNQICLFDEDNDFTLNDIVFYEYDEYECDWITRLKVIIRILEKNFELGSTDVRYLNYCPRFDDGSSDGTVLHRLLDSKNWSFISRAVSFHANMINLNGTPININNPEYRITILQKLFEYNAPFELIFDLFRNNIRCGLTLDQLNWIEPGFQWLYSYAESFNPNAHHAAYFETSMTNAEVVNQQFREAAASKTIDDMQAMLKNKWVDLNSKDTQDRTALFYAIEHENTNTACYLLYKKADFSSQDKQGRTPVDGVIEKKNVVVLNFMKAIVCFKYHSKNVDAVLDLAQKQGESESVKILETWKQWNCNVGVKLKFS